MLFGRQPSGLFFTDDIVATGLKVAINPLEGLSFAGMFFTNFEDDGELGMLPFELKEDPTKPGKYTATSYIHQKNLWSLAAMYQNEMLDIEAWYTGINKVANLFALSAGLSYGINDNVSLRSKAQWAYANLTNKFKENYRGIMAAPNEIPVANSNFFGIELGASFHGFDIDAGYITYGKKDKTSIQSIEDQGSFISAGEELLDFTSFEGKHKVWFAKAKYTYDAYFIGVDYVCDKVKNAPRLGKNAKASEWVVRAGYKYNDKLKFNAWYSMTTQKYDTIDFATGRENKSKDKFNRLRFDAVYNF